MTQRIDDKKTRKIIFDKYGGHCAYCGTKLKQNNFTVDHIVPKRRGDKNVIKGADKIYNYNPCCNSCNSSKGSFPLDKWREEIRLKIMRVNKDSSKYRLLKRFGLVKETNIPVVFYFEKCCDGS